MDSDAFDWWLRLGLNVWSIALFAWAWVILRRARRHLDETQATRALVTERLVAAERLLRECATVAGDDDDAPADPPLH
jgi:hypothetical protein